MLTVAVAIGGWLQCGCSAKWVHEGLVDYPVSITGSYAIFALVGAVCSIWLFGLPTAVRCVAHERRVLDESTFAARGMNSRNADKVTLGLGRTDDCFRESSFRPAAILTVPITVVFASGTNPIPRLVIDSRHVT